MKGIRKEYRMCKKGIERGAKSTGEDWKKCKERTRRRIRERIKKDSGA